MTPQLFTFDILGTVVDWQRGLSTDLARLGRSLDGASFDRVIDAQGRDEQAQFRTYREITARSLVSELGLGAVEADQIGAGLGRWPAFADAAAGLRALLTIAPCVAMTNSDREHGAGIQQSLGVALSAWICAEDVRVYKPSAAFWHAVSRQLGVLPSRVWWHVSAYADYDLEVAAGLGLTTVLVTRAHQRPGPAHLRVSDLLELAQLAATPEGP